MSGHGAPVRRVAILLPLSGGNAGLGQAMLRAARVALSVPGSPELDVRDTAGTPEGAAEAARLAVAAGDQLILGPLTSTETAAVAPVAGPANVAVLAFTSDPAQARPGVWVLGITPDQQVGRLVEAARADGRSRFAAVLPEGAFGAALAAALSRDVGADGNPPDIRRATTFAATGAALKQVSGYERRRAAAEAQLTAAREQDPAATSPVAQEPQPDASTAASTPAVAPEAAPPTPVRVGAAELAAQPVPIDALLLGGAGSGLRDLATLLPAYDLKPPAVRVLGPALWARDAAHLGGLAGAWYAGPDPALRAGFVRAYLAAGAAPPFAPAAGAGPGAAAIPDTPPPSPPPAFADLAYDAAALARVLAAQGYGPVALQRPEGFAGTDGVFALQPDGTVRRELAVFEIDPGGGSHRVTLATAGSRPPGS